MTSANDEVNNSRSHTADGLLAGFLPDDKRQLRKLKKRVVVEPGKCLVKTGDRPGKIFVHRRGDILTIPAWGEETPECGQTAATEIVYGLTEALSGNGFNFSIMSITATEFDIIEKDDFFNFMRHRPELIQKLLTRYGTLFGDALRILKEQ